LWIPPEFRLPEPEFTKEQLDILEEIIQLISPNVSSASNGMRDSRAKMAGFLVDLGTGIWRVRRKIDGMESVPREISDALYSLESIWKSMSEGGVEVVDHIGTIPSKREARIVETREVSGLEREQVVDALVPTILLKGEVVQMGEVIMGVPASDAAAQEANAAPDEPPVKRAPEELWRAGLAKAAPAQAEPVQAEPVQVEGAQAEGDRGEEGTESLPESAETGGEPVDIESGSSLEETPAEEFKAEPSPSGDEPAETLGLDETDAGGANEAAADKKEGKEDASEALARILDEEMARLAAAAQASPASSPGGNPDDGDGIMALDEEPSPSPDENAAPIPEDGDGIFSEPMTTAPLSRKTLKTDDESLTPEFSVSEPEIPEEPSQEFKTATGEPEREFVADGNGLMGAEPVDSAELSGFAMDGDATSPGEVEIGGPVGDSLELSQDAEEITPELVEPEDARAEDSQTETPASEDFQPGLPPIESPETEQSPMEQSQIEQSQTEQVQPEQAQPEPSQTEQAQPEQVQTEQAQPESSQMESPQVETPAPKKRRGGVRKKASSGQAVPEGVQLEQVQPEQAQPEPSQTEQGSVEPSEPASSHSEPSQTEPPQTETSQVETPAPSKRRGGRRKKDEISPAAGPAEANPQPEGVSEKSATKSARKKAAERTKPLAKNAENEETEEKAKQKPRAPRRQKGVDKKEA
jgi:hypothetical protein